MNGTGVSEIVQTQEEERELFRSVEIQDGDAMTAVRLSRSRIFSNESGRAG
jgi:hypothetical protein